MNNYMFWSNANSVIYPVKGLIAYRAPPYTGTLYNVGFMDEEAQRNYTALRFPPKAKDFKGQQVQKMNYDIFIRTMADLVKKYNTFMQN